LPHFVAYYELPLFSLLLALLPLLLRHITDSAFAMLIRHYFADFAEMPCCFDAAICGACFRRHDCCSMLFFFFDAFFRQLAFYSRC